MVYLDPNKVPKKSNETLLYLSSLTVEETSIKEMRDFVGGHWTAIENGVHYMRDVSCNEDACRIAHRTAAQVFATLRNLAIGLYELDKKHNRTKATSLASWRRSMTVSNALKKLCR